MAAAGNTGLPTAIQLLSEGFAVTALVRRQDARSEQLKSLGAHIVVGSMTDIVDMRTALEGVERAYFCTPLREGYLTAAATFISVAAQSPLKHVVVMSQWLSNPTHPSRHTRESWFTDQLLALIPGCDLTILNPGYFADNEMQVLPMASQFGVMMLPYGNGKNAPPSNEDMGRVAAEILARPEGHEGKTYRITGPKLLSPEEIVAVVSKVLGRKVRYINAPIEILLKVVVQMGFGEYAASQMEHYSYDYQQDAFAVGGPTDVVRRITGRDAEGYETIVRRYAAALPDVKPSLASKVKLFAILNLAMLRRKPKSEVHLATHYFSDPNHIRLSATSSEWRDSHDSQDNSHREATAFVAKRTATLSQPVKSA